MITVKRINDEKIKPVVCYNNNDPKMVLGSNLFSDPFCNIFIASKKRSGKSTLIYRILQKCVNKHVKVIIFCSTVHKDPVYVKLTEMLEKKKVAFETHLSIMENGVNQLAKWEHELNQAIEREKEKKTKPKIKFISVDSDSDDDDGTPKKSKKIVPDYFFIFDDLSMEMNDKSLSYLMSRNKNFRCKVLVSSQYYQHLSKGARAQVDYLIIFGKMPEEKLEIMHKEADLSIEYDQFKRLYEHSTAEPYNFLFVDCRNEIYRHNFNCQYSV